MKVLVTGANGFVGLSVVNQLAKVDGIEVCATSRNTEYEALEGVHSIVVTGLQADTDWSKALTDAEVIVHTAGIAHSMLSRTGALAEYRRVNVDGTLKLAKQAAQMGVKRFVFLSSIKVNGESTGEATFFTPDDASTTCDPYGISKREAENGLLKLVSHGGVLPLGAVHNKRSFVALDNLVSFIMTCIDHPKAANEIFLVSDGEDVSTTELLKIIASSLGKAPWLVPIPPSWMRFFAQLVGKGKIADRLFSSLQVDSSKARRLLDWEPIVNMDEQLKSTAKAYLNEKNI